MISIICRPKYSFKNKYWHSYERAGEPYRNTIDCMALPFIKWAFNSIENVARHYEGLKPGLRYDIIRRGK